MTQAPNEPIIKRTQVIVGEPKPAPAPEKVKLPETEAELEERRASVMAAMWGPKPKPAATPAPEPVAEGEPPAATAAEGEPAAAAPVAPAAEPAAPAATPPAPVAATPVDAQALITETAKQIGEQVGRVMDQKAPAAPPEPEPEPELTPEDVRDAEIIAKMEELDPSIKGRAEAFKAFAHRRYAYEADWRAKHPGADFNSEDAEHEDFYKGQPEIDPDAYEDAKAELRVDRKVAQRLKPIEEKAEANERRTKSEKAIAAAAPTIAANLTAKIIETVGNVSAEVAGLLKDMNPLALKPDEIAKLEDADPIAASVMGELVVKEMVPMLLELEKSVAPDAEYSLDPRTNPVHAGIARYLAKFEQQTAAKPVKRDGRDFLTLAEMIQRQNTILASKSSDDVKRRNLEGLQERYWIATVDDIQKTIVRDISERSKAAVEQLDGMARRKYKPEPKTPAAKSAAAPPVAEPPPTPAANGKPRPPAVNSQAATVDTSRAGQPAGKSFGEIAVATHWGS